MPMVSLKLMAGAARSMVVASARTTAAEIAARWCARKVRGELVGILFILKRNVSSRGVMACIAQGAFSEVVGPYVRAAAAQVQAA